MQHDHAAGQHADDAAEAFLLAPLHLLELLKLAGIEEAGMGIEGAKHSRNGSLIQGGVGIHRVGGFAFHHREHVHQLLHFGEQFFRGVASNW